jgi:WhiB family transcriptional regulator, redox-sensing transcriptional regulator
MFATELNDELYDIDRPARKWDEARCRATEGPDASLWFSEQIPDIAAAKAICATCTLVEDCLDGALARREPWGVWGGQLFVNGKILAQKRKRGRPPKNRPLEDGIALTA